MINPPQSIEFRLKAAIESENFEQVPALLAEYSAHVAAMDLPPEQQVKDFLNWAHRTLMIARSHASDQFQLLSDSRTYSKSESDRKTWQVML